MKVNCAVVGPDYVTVGVPSSVECDCTCQDCTYSISLDGQVAQGQGNVLAFTVNSWVEALKVTCTATDDKTLLTATSTKQLQVLGRAQRVWIIDRFYEPCHMVCSQLLYCVHSLLKISACALPQLDRPTCQSQDLICWVQQWPTLTAAMRTVGHLAPMPGGQIKAHGLVARGMSFLLLLRRRTAPKFSSAKPSTVCLACSSQLIVT